jgi:hypothetical protein
VESTGTLVQFRRSYDNFSSFKSYGGSLELQLSLTTGSHIWHMSPTNHSGHKHEWTVYYSLRNMNSMIRS